MSYDHYANVDFDTTIERALDDLSRNLVNCLKYWNAIRGDRPFPAWREIDLVQIPAAVLPLVTVVDLDWDDTGNIDATRIVYRFWGTGHVRAKNIERTGTSIAEHSSRTKVVESEYRRVIHERRPVAFTKNIRLDAPLRATEQTSLRLPISNDGKRIDHVLSVSEWADIDTSNSYR